MSGRSVPRLDPGVARRLLVIFESSPASLVFPTIYGTFLLNALLFVTSIVVDVIGAVPGYVDFIFVGAYYVHVVLLIVSLGIELIDYTKRKRESTQPLYILFIGVFMYLVVLVAHALMYMAIQKTDANAFLQQGQSFGIFSRAVEGFLLAAGVATTNGLPAVVPLSQAAKLVVGLHAVIQHIFTLTLIGASVGLVTSLY